MKTMKAFFARHQKMKWIILLGVLSYVVFVGGTAVKEKYWGVHLSADEFLEMAGERDEAGSMSSLSYDGHLEGRVYLGSWKMNRFPRSIDYWIEIDELPYETKQDVLSASGRWKVDDRRFENSESEE